MPRNDRGRSLVREALQIARRDGADDRPAAGADADAEPGHVRRAGAIVPERLDGAGACACDGGQDAGAETVEVRPVEGGLPVGRDGDAREQATLLVEDVDGVAMEHVAHPRRPAPPPASMLGWRTISSSSWSASPTVSAPCKWRPSRSRRA